MIKKADACEGIEESLFFLNYHFIHARITTSMNIYESDISYSKFFSETLCLRFTLTCRSEERTAPGFTLQKGAIFMEDQIHVVRNYKDTLFRFIFNDKAKLLELYNALNGTSYCNPDDPELELKVTMLNINHGYNEELLRRCKTLKEYSIFVARVRTKAETLPIEKAVDLAVTECIREGILADILATQRAEVVAMSIFEYNEEIELKKMRQGEYEVGVADGKKSEKQKEKQKISFLSWKIWEVWTMLCGAELLWKKTWNVYRSG